jgi:hypothetical protein
MLGLARGVNAICETVKLATDDLDAMLSAWPPVI